MSIYYSSNPLNERAVKCLGQFYITVQTVQQFSHFSIQVQHESDVRSTDRTTESRFLFFCHISHFQRPRFSKSSRRTSDNVTFADKML